MQSEMASYKDKRSQGNPALMQALLDLYRFPKLRRIIYKAVLRIEGGPFFSKTIRKILIRYHNVSVGKYSYGECLIPGKLPPGTIVGNYCSVAKGISVFRRNHPIDHFSQHPFFYNKSLGFLENDTITQIEDNPLVIGHDVWIGSAVTILPGCKNIGNGAILGAASVVTKDVPEYAIVAGNPANLIRQRFTPELEKIIGSTEWWNKSLEEVLADEKIAQLNLFIGKVK